MIAFICCSATSGFALNVSIEVRLGCPGEECGRKRGLGYDIGVRPCGNTVTAAVMVLAGTGTSGLWGPGARDAHGEPTSDEAALETGGFFGLGLFPDDIELGNSWAQEQVPQSAPVFGGRIG